MAEFVAVAAQVMCRYADSRPGILAGDQGKLFHGGILQTQHLEFLREICRRPVLYVGSAGLPEVCAYIGGIHVSTGCLTGFREWLVTELDGAPELTWESLVKNEVAARNLADGAAVDHLGTLFEALTTSCIQIQQSHTAG